MAATTASSIATSTLMNAHPPSPSTTPPRRKSEELEEAPVASSPPERKMASQNESERSSIRHAAKAAATDVAHKVKQKAKDVKEKAHLGHHYIKGDALDHIKGTYRLEGNKALLHGNIHVKIIKCTNLKNMDCTLFASCAPTYCINDVSDPYVACYAGEHRIAKSSYKENDLNPVYNEDFYVSLAYYVENLRFEVKDRDFNLYAQMIGENFLPVEDLLKWDDNGKPLRVGIHKKAWLDNKTSHGSLEYFVDYVPVELLAELPMEVPGVYFQQTNGNQVKLYVNAEDVSSPDKKPLKYGLEGDPKQQAWTPQRLWRDTFDAICQAQIMIYITGWSVDVSQSLLRGKEKEEAIKNGKYSPYIGELLKQKAEEGVVVNVLVWDDATSNNILRGMMGTKDEEAKDCFHNSKVALVLAPMAGDEMNNLHEKVHSIVALLVFQGSVSDDINFLTLLLFWYLLSLGSKVCDVYASPKVGHGGCSSTKKSPKARASGICWRSRLDLWPMGH
jgi:hypothetical protein